MPAPESMSPDALRRLLHALRTRAADADSRIAALEGAGESAAAGLADNTPRWIEVDVSYTDFPDKATTSVFALANLPAGTVCTHQWIEPRAPFVSPSTPIWRMSILKAGDIYSASGSAKDVDVTTPDATPQQHAAELIVSDLIAGPQDWSAQIDSGGSDNAEDLTAGTVTVHLLVSVPGSTADNLPHG